MFELFNPRPGAHALPKSGPNRWDWILLPLVLAVLGAIAFGAMQMTRPFTVGQVTPISLDPAYLPYYLLRTMLRMPLHLSLRPLLCLPLRSLLRMLPLLRRRAAPLMWLLFCAASMIRR